VVYDTRWGNALHLGRESRNLTSNHPNVNDYDRKSFRFPYLGPLASVQFNPDDGLFLGGGVLVRRPGFRKEPFASQHKLTGNYAFATGAYNFDYRGDFTQVLGRLDAQVNLEAKAPNFTGNFFGLGNASVYDQENDISYYRVRYDQYRANVLLRKTLFHRQAVFAGPVLESVAVEPTPDRYLEREGAAALARENLFGRKHYGGIQFGFDFDNRDSRFLPTEGTYWYTEGAVLGGLNGSSNAYGRLESALTGYWTLRLPARLTLATRVGGGVTWGDYEFFQARTLGGLTNLRGYRRTRFSGKSSLYNNTELRLRLFSFRTYLFPGYFGLLAFHDVGRVWLPGEDSQAWHRGYGGGIWVAPLKQIVLSVMYGVSDEDRLPVVKAGFFF
jgi:outer membrane protein assembly factor BamA